jgi:hypothetical protein
VGAELLVEGDRLGAELLERLLDLLGLLGTGQGQQPIDALPVFVEGLALRVEQAPVLIVGDEGFIVLEGLVDPGARLLDGLLGVFTFLGSVAMRCRNTRTRARPNSMATVFSASMLGTTLTLA